MEASGSPITLERVTENSGALIPFPSLRGDFMRSMLSRIAGCISASLKRSMGWIESTPFPEISTGICGAERRGGADKCCARAAQNFARDTECCKIALRTRGKASRPLGMRKTLRTPSRRV